MTRRAGPLALLLRSFVLAYRWGVSPLFPPRCRFQPTCSEYALDALSTHGALRGSWLTVRRILRCHPWGGAGFDPVPSRPEPPASAATAPGGCRHGR